MRISEMKCSEFIEVLASKEPVPGGGGAAALCAAVGTALGNMVGSLTAGKKKYADVESEILEMKEKCRQIQEECLQLIDADAQCFLPLSKAYSLPAKTQEEIERKADVLEKCSKDAALVPFRIMEQCCEGICLAERFAAIGSKLAVSDAGCAAVILNGALKAASFNIFINTKGMKDRSFAQDLNQRAEQMLEYYGEKADGIFRNVKAELQS